VLRKEHILLLLCARHLARRCIVNAVVANAQLDVCDRRAEGRVYADRDMTGQNPARARLLAKYPRLGWEWRQGACEADRG
jgi:hypothetical protein